MTIVVCVKQVPSSNDVKVDPVTKNLLRDSAEGMMNPFDKHAVEAALQLKAKTGSKGGGAQHGAGAVRRHAARSHRHGVRRGHAGFLPAPSPGPIRWPRPMCFARRSRKIGDVELVLFGRHAVDADTGQVGPLVAEFLGLPQATFAKSIELVDGGFVQVTRLLDKVEETVKVKLPAVITVTSELNTPRYATPLKILKAASKEIPVFNESDLGCDSERIGMRGSRTIVTNVFAPPKRNRSATILEGKPDEIAKKLVDALLRKSVS